MSIRYDLDSFMKQINALFVDKKLFQNLYHSISGVTAIMKAIHKTNGNNWALHAVYDNGTPLFSDKDTQEQFTQLFHPYVNLILNFLGNKTDKTDKTMKGGDEPKQIDGVVNSNNSKSDLESELEQDKPVGPDDMYVKALEKIDSINFEAHKLANEHGILYYQREIENKGDVHIVPSILTNSIKALGPTGEAVGLFLSNMKLPIRTIVFFIHLILDVIRIYMSIAGSSDTNLKIMSILVALIELLKGDWKQAIITFVGLYGQMPLLIGQNIKIFLYLYETLSPQLREDILYGMVSVPKSIVVGILLTMFKIMAPFEVREPVKKALAEIKEKNIEINKILVDKDLKPRADYFSPDYEDFNNLQALISGDNDYICSCEFEELLKPLYESSIIYIIIQILGIPINEEFRRVKCGKPECTPFIDNIVESSSNTKKDNTTLEPLSNIAKKSLSNLHEFMSNIELFIPQDIQEYLAKIKKANTRTPELDDQINKGIRLLMERLPESITDGIKDKIITAIVSTVYINLEDRDAIVKDFLNKLHLDNNIRASMTHIPASLTAEQKNTIIERYINYVYKGKEPQDRIDTIIKYYISYIEERDSSVFANAAKQIEADLNNAALEEIKKIIKEVTEVPVTNKPVNNALNKVTNKPSNTVTNKPVNNALNTVTNKPVNTVTNKPVNTVTNKPENATNTVKPKNATNETIVAKEPIAQNEAQLGGAYRRKTPRRIRYTKK